MGGLNNPSQQVFDPTPPQVRPLQQMLVQAMMGMSQRPQQNRNPMAGQMPSMGNIFSQLYGAPSGQPPGMPPGQPIHSPQNPVMRPPTALPEMQVGQMANQIGSVPSGSRMIRSAPGGNMPTFFDLMNLIKGRR